MRKNKNVIDEQLFFFYWKYFWIVLIFSFWSVFLKLQKKIEMLYSNGYSMVSFPKALPYMGPFESRSFSCIRLSNHLLCTYYGKTTFDHSGMFLSFYVFNTLEYQTVVFILLRVHKLCETIYGCWRKLTVSNFRNKINILKNI